MAWNLLGIENVCMDAISAVGAFFFVIVGCVVIDWHFRGVSARNCRRARYAEVESYLRQGKRI